MASGVLKISSLVVYFLTLYFTLGQLEFFIENKITNIIQLFLFFLLLVYFIANAKVYPTFIKYIYSLFFLLIAFLYFPVGSDLIGDFSRFVFFSLYILIPSFYLISCRDFYKSIIFVIKFYYFLGVVIVLDSLLYFVLGKVFIFDVVFYFVPRFYGPFNDPNFMGFIYGIMFLCSIYLKSPNSRLFNYKIIFIFCILLSGSLTAILLTLVTVSLIKLKIFSPKRIVYKPMLAVLFTFLFVPFFISNKDTFFDFGYQFVSYFINVDLRVYQVKFDSLLFRYESVNAAINYIRDNPLGYGYRTLLEYLPRDTHNSYIGMAFEYGVFILILILFSMSCSVTEQTSQALSTFVCLFGLLLNVHYMPIYFFVILVIFVNRQVKNRIPT